MASTSATASQKQILMTVDRGKTAKSALWSLVENGGLAAVSLGTLVIYTHLLSTAEFGLFSVILALVEVLQVFVTMLFHDALVQRKDATDRHFDTAFTFNMVLSAVLMVLCFIGASPFAASLAEPKAAAALCAMTLCFPAAALSSTIVARQRRSFEFRALALRSLLGRVVGAVMGVVLIVMGAGIWGLIAQQVLIQAVGSAFLWVTCKERPKFRFSTAEFKELGSFGAYALGTLFLGFGIKRLFTVAAGFFLGVEVAGYLNLSFRAIDVFWSIAATAAGQVALPMLASLQHDLPRLKRAFQQAMGFVCLILYPSFIGIGAVAPELVEVMFGAKWLPSAPYITLLSWLVLVQAPRVLVAPLFTALGRPKDLVLGKAVEFAFVAAAVAISRVPTLGWAIGIWIARELFALPVSVRLLSKASGFGVVDQFRGAQVPLAAGLAMAVAVATARFALPASLPTLGRLALFIGVGVVSFAGVSYVLSPRLVRSLLEFASAALRRGRKASPALALSRLP